MLYLSLKEHSLPGICGLSSFRSSNTWSLVFSLSQGDSEIPFTEEDYRRRKHHPNFLDHINAEKLVLKLGKKVNLEQQNLQGKKSSFGSSLQCTWSGLFHILYVYHVSSLPTSVFSSRVLIPTELRASGSPKRHCPRSCPTFFSSPLRWKACMESPAELKPSPPKGSVGPKSPLVQKSQKAESGNGEEGTTFSLLPDSISLVSYSSSEKCI